MDGAQPPVADCRTHGKDEPIRDHRPVVDRRRCEARLQPANRGYSQDNNDHCDSDGHIFPTKTDCSGTVLRCVLVVSGETEPLHAKTSQRGDGSRYLACASPSVSPLKVGGTLDVNSDSLFRAARSRS